MKRVICLFALVLFFVSCKKETESTLTYTTSDVMQERSSTIYNFENYPKESLPKKIKRMPYFRIYDRVNNNLNSDYLRNNKAVKTSADVIFHNRFQDFVNNYFDLQVDDTHLFNMLNIALFIDENGNPQPNPKAYGNAWLIDNLVQVDQAGAELVGIAAINPRVEALVLKTEFGTQLINFKEGDGKGTIKMTSFQEDLKVYKANTESPQIACFSELWNPDVIDVFVNGKKATPIRVNYVIYALMLPAGESEIEFRFKQ